MDTRHWLHVVGLFAVALVVRAIFFDKVGIWGDWGFYAYNSRLVLEGQRPFIDFLGRSPLFIYSYTAVRYLFGHVVDTLRAFIVFWWLATGVPVYLIARRIRDHTTALAALTVYLFAPFAITYGYWANTQALAAFIATWGVWVVVRSVNDSERTVPIHATAFTTFGSLAGLAFLSRRSVIVMLPALALYAGYLLVRARETMDYTHEMRNAVTALSGACVGFVAAIMLGYLALAYGDVQTALALAQTHALNLFLSVGRGGYPLLGVETPAVTKQLMDGRIPIFNDVCQRCGSWTARTFAKTLLVTLPVAGLFLGYMRDLSMHYWTERQKHYVGGILLLLGGYGAITALAAGYETRAVAVIVILLFSVAIWRVDIPRSILYQRETAFLLVLLFGLSAGYLYRNRILHTYYFADFWPFVSVVAGILLITIWRRADVTARTLLTVAIALGVVVSGASAHPVTNIVLDDNEDGWFTTHNIGEYADDLDQRTDPGDVVFTANPSYVALSDARMVNDNARIHYVAATFHDNSWGPHLPMYKRLADGFRSGEIRYVIMTSLSVKMLRYNETARTAFEQNYCRVESADELYQETGAYLYKWTGGGNATVGAAQCQTRPVVEKGMLTNTNATA